MPLNIDWQQILLHWMNLAILAGGLYFLLYKPVRQFMEKREAHYREMDRQAAEKLEEAGQMKAEAEAKLAKAEDEAREERAKAQAAAQQAAGAQLEQSKERALRESQRELRDLAAKAVRKMVPAPGSDPFDHFLNLAEGGEKHEGR